MRRRALFPDEITFKFFNYCQKCHTDDQNANSFQMDTLKFRAIFWKKDKLHRFSKN